MKEAAIAYSPASVGNVSVGFDLLGHVLDGPGDTVTASRIRHAGVIIETIDGCITELPREASKNTASAAVMSLLQSQQADFGVSLRLHKGIPLGSGLGGSAASATAALVAANALLESPLPRRGLYPHALVGESVASGDAHGDNVAPQLLGGLVLACGEQLIELPVPAGLTAVVVHPQHVVETRRARQALAAPYSLADLTRQQAALARLICACYRHDVAMLRAGLDDVLVEPRRSALIPGFAAVKAAALDHGAITAGISGAGPSVFAWFGGEQQNQAQAAAEAMCQAFGEHGLAAKAYTAPVNSPGARLLEVIG
jgi:homoserine kinase